MTGIQRIIYMLEQYGLDHEKEVKAIERERDALWALIEEFAELSAGHADVSMRLIHEKCLRAKQDRWA